MRKRIELKAVWDDDLHELLDNLGVIDDLVAGETRCMACSRIVVLDNLGAIIPSSESVQITCDDSNCVKVATSQEALV